MKDLSTQQGRWFLVMATRKWSRTFTNRAVVPSHRPRVDIYWVCSVCQAPCGCRRQGESDGGLLGLRWGDKRWAHWLSSQVVVSAGRAQASLTPWWGMGHEDQEGIKPARFSWGQKEEFSGEKNRKEHSIRSSRPQESLELNPMLTCWRSRGWKQAWWWRLVIAAPVAAGQSPSSRPTWDTKTSLGKLWLTFPKDWGRSSMAGCLASMGRARGSTPSSTNKPTKNKIRKMWI